MEKELTTYEDEDSDYHSDSSLHFGEDISIYNQKSNEMDFLKQFLIVLSVNLVFDLSHLIDEQHGQKNKAFCPCHKHSEKWNKMCGNFEIMSKDDKCSKNGTFQDIKAFRQHCSCQGKSSIYHKAISL